MKKLIPAFNKTLMALSMSLFVSLPVLAVDTEIYTGANNAPSSVKPNLVFIIDTSGSMDTNVTVTTGTYDPATTYEGDCATDRVYWSTSGSPPGCGTSRYFLASSNKCSASATALSAGGDGFYVTRAARYKAKNNGDIWDDLSNNDHDDAVECQDDYGVHGETDDATNLYPADEDGGGPWRVDDTNAINWNNTGRTYTFYNGNYLNWRYSPGTTETKTRLTIVKEVFSDLMDSISDINIAVMRFDNKSETLNQGGYFAMPMQTLTADNRQSYKDAVNAFTANGYTPLSETLYESYLFYKGAAVDFGDNTDPATNVEGVLDPDDTSKYESPIEYQCQKNFVILLTDGEPTYDTDADSQIEGLSGFSAVTGASSCSGNCLDELADYMYTKDCRTTGMDDIQNVITYTIGFNTDQTLLNNAATKGGGKYYTADDTAGLTDVFTEILTEILAINTTFIAPAVSVNAFNRFTHRDELYYALFRPNTRPKWFGNVKRYKLAGDPPIIVDVNNNAAINPNTGFFTSTARSFWTPDANAPDGDDVKLGGASSMFTDPRTIFTYTGDTAPSDVTLNVDAHKLLDTNNAITKTMLGDAAMTDARRTALLTWAKGIDTLEEDGDGVDTDVRPYMGDPLHAKPVLITYGGTDADPDITLFAGTNEGHLLAINSVTGAELFTFVPQELLPNLATLYDNSANVAHPYGLDGPLTTWVNDANGNGVIYDANDTLETGEHAYIYQGMRRGGKNYYALNVTDRTSPILKWVIKGGVGGFSELAQTWSSATRAKIKLNGTDTQVLIFGGGYDAATQDDVDNTIAVNDTEGRAIFMVNASTGAKIWQAGPAGSGNDTGGDPNLVLSAMTNSIPSDVRVLDVNGDGYSDRMYVGDMRGQIWRFDIHNDTNTSAANLVTGGVIAELGGNTAATNRRFYYSPDVSLAKGATHLNIAIGSGYRAHPLNTVIHDAFFVIQDRNVYGPALNADGDPVYTAVTLANLYNATANTIGEGNNGQINAARTQLQNSQGLYIYMNENNGSFVGEKVLAKSITYSGKVMFTTYKPVAVAQAACSPSQGQASAYLIDISDGTPVADFDVSGGDFTRDDRRINLVRGGIPPEPSLVFHENGPVILIGTEKGPDPDILLQPRKTHWSVQ
ncbi:pilus assembly protein [Kaarinaea lacus]